MDGLLAVPGVRRQFAQPTGTDLYVSVPLSNVLVNYFQDAARHEFIADRVFPRVGVRQQGGQYWVFPKSAWFRSEAKPIPPATQTPGTGWTTSRDSYFAAAYGIHKDNSDQDYANVAAPLDLDRSATNFVGRQIALLREIVWAQNFFLAGLWGTNLTGVDATPGAGTFLRWNVAGSTPIRDIRVQAIEMQQRTGFRPNRLVLGPRVYEALVNHADIIDRIADNTTRLGTRQLLATLFDVDEVLVPNLIQNTAPEGTGDAMSFIFGNHALLAYAPAAAAIDQPSAGYVFAWEGLLGAGAFGADAFIKRFRMEEISSWRIEAWAAFDMKLVAADLGTFFATAIA